MAGREAIDAEMVDVVTKFDGTSGDATGKRRVRLMFDKNDERVAMARITEDGTVEKEVDRTTYRAHDVLDLTAAKKGQDIDDSNTTVVLVRSPDERVDDSDATTDLHGNNNMDVDVSDATIDLI